MSITITSKRAGFRRCGMPHPAEPVTYDDDKFSEEELKALKAEPMLVVVESEDKDAAKKKAAPEPKPKPNANTSAGTAVPTKPEGEALTAAIVAIIPELKGAEDFTASGTPKVKSVETALGYDVTGDEVAAAFETYTKSKDDA
jgi:hypothetical protein